MNEMIPNAPEKEAKPVAQEPDFGELAHSPSVSMWLRPANFAHMQRLAQLFSASDIVPKHFQGNPANCMIALSFAFRMALDPMFAFQNLYIVYGTPGMSAQLMISLANKSGVFDGPIEFDVQGDGDKLAVTAIGTLAKSGRKVTDTITLAQAKEAGWTRQKDGGMKPMWKARPVVMLRYRSAASLIRAYAPDALNGMLIDDEIEDLNAEKNMIDITERTREMLNIPQASDAPEEPEKPTRPIAENAIQEDEPKTGKTADSETQAEAEKNEPAPTSEDPTWDF